MSIDKTILGKVTKGDIVLILGVIILIVLLFMGSFSGGDSLRAEIYLDGEMVEEIDLSGVQKSYSINIASCELLIEKDGVTFLSSECDDGLCIKRGKMTKKGDAMACVPQRVVVSIKSTKGKAPDGVTY